jgi:hypothetical protein
VNPDETFEANLRNLHLARVRATLAALSALRSEREDEKNLTTETASSTMTPAQYTVLTFPALY